MKRTEVVKARSLTPYQRGVLVDLMFHLEGANSVGALYRTVESDLPEVLKVSTGRGSEVAAFERLSSGSFHGLKIKGENNFRRYAQKPEEAPDNWVDQIKKHFFSLDDKVFESLINFETCTDKDRIYFPVRGCSDFDGELVSAVRISEYEFRNEREWRFVRLYLEAFGISLSNKLHWKRKRLERDELIRSFGDMAHRINNLLGPAKGYASILLRKVDDERLRSMAQKIEVSLDTVADRINVMAEMAETKSFAIPPEFFYAELDIYRYLTEKVVEIEFDSSQRVNVEVEDGLSVHCDRASIADALDELLENAKHNTPLGSKIEIKANKRNGTVNLTIKNFGIYRTPDELSRILERGYSKRLDGSESTGVGLSYVINVIQSEHNGKIVFNSVDGEDPYFEVKVELPARE